MTELEIGFEGNMPEDPYATTIIVRDILRQIASILGYIAEGPVVCLRREVKEHSIMMDFGFDRGEDPDGLMRKILCEFVISVCITD